MNSLCPLKCVLEFGCFGLASSTLQMIKHTHRCVQNIKNWWGTEFCQNRALEGCRIALEICMNQTEPDQVGLVWNLGRVRSEKFENLVGSGLNQVACVAVGERLGAPGGQWPVVH